MSSKVEFKYPFKIGRAEDYGTVLENLNEKIDNVKKQISYFDTYNITTVITDSAKFASQLNALPLNEGLVINTPSFSDGSTTYTTGDVLLKLANNQVVHIKAQTGGVYYPAEIEKTGELYSIKYVFSGHAPKQTDEAQNVSVKTSTNTTGTTAKLAQSINFNGLIPADSENSYVYGIWDQLKAEASKTQIEFSFKAYYFSETSGATPNLIYPFIQIFMCDESEAPSEQAYVDFELVKPTSTNSNWIVKLDKSLNGYYIKVK